MLSVKVQCGCGQRYSFDVEPHQGRMPSTIACPICGADGTGQANAIIAQQLNSIAAQAPPPVPSAPAPPAVPAGPRLRTASHAAAVAAPAEGPPIAPPGVATPAGRPARGTIRSSVPATGNDGWSADESPLNKFGSNVTVIPSAIAALLAWGMFGLEISTTLLLVIVSICGIVGGVLNLWGRGPVIAGAIVGLVIALGGFGAVYFWITGRDRVRTFEVGIAFLVGALPGFGLQWVLQQWLRKRGG